MFFFILFFVLQSNAFQIVLRSILPKSDLLNPGKSPSLCRQCSWDKCFPHLQARHVGLGSREPRREPPPGQSTWSRETLRALFPFAWLHVKWVFAYWEDQDPPGGGGSTQPPLNSTRRHAYTGLTVGTFMIWHHLCLSVSTNTQTAQLRMSLLTKGRSWR